MHHASILSLLFGLASAIPVVEVPSMAEIRAEAGDMSKRQSANGQAHLCDDNGCTDCPWFMGAGTGYPNCRVYDTAQFSDITHPDENGQGSVYFDFPEPDPTCRWIVLSPAGRDQDRCGTPVLTATGAACQRVAIQSTFMLQFCCGTGDCTAAATKHRRDITSNNLFSRAGSTGALYMINSTSGLAVTPMDEGPPISQPKLSKRDCGDFVVTEGPYSSIGAPQRVSDDVACPATGACTAELTKEASQSRTISASVSVGDPFGIISASVGVDFTKESSRSFTGTFPLQEGASGYVVYTPYTQCYRGYFSGDCDDNGQSIEACYPEKRSDGSLLGQLRGVIIRT